MALTQTMDAFPAVSNSAGLFETSKKITVIRLRWLIVIISSYLLAFPYEAMLDPFFIRGLIVFYLLTNAALYFLDEKLFDSSYFYTPLVIFDTLFVTASMVISGQVATDFYLSYFIVIILCTVWQDFRGLIVVAVLATALYSYFLFQTTTVRDPSIVLRIPFLFIISLFYGYFAEVVRREKTLKEQAKQEAEDMAMIQTLSQSLPSSLDYRQILTTIGEKINRVVHAAKFYVLVEDEMNDPSRGLLYSGEKDEEAGPDVVELKNYPLVQECLKKRHPIIQQNVGSPSEEPEENSQVFSFPLSITVPITFRNEAHGAFLLGFDEGNRILTSREIHFCQILAFATAVALSNAKKFDELRMEAKQRQLVAEELAEANRLKTLYLANTSDELRTPITTIMGYGSILLDGACGPLNDEQKKSVGQLTENARSLLRLVDQVLDYSKLERGERRLYKKRQEVGVLLDEIKGELAPLEANRPYKVQYNISDCVPPLETDWRKLKSILVNLLNNAIKFTDVGEVKLSVMNGSANHEVSFVVSDTGIGIPKEHLSMIFNKFHQVDGSTAKRYQGTGLGLTISKNLVELLSGRIEVESELGKGSTFTVTMPVRN
jgi:signal transduction histidine kinase